MHARVWTLLCVNPFTDRSNLPVLANSGASSKLGRYATSLTTSRRPNMRLMITPLRVKIPGAVSSKFSLLALRDAAPRRLPLCALRNGTRSKQSLLCPNSIQRTR